MNVRKKHQVKGQRGRSIEKVYIVKNEHSFAELEKIRSTIDYKSKAYVYIINKHPIRNRHVKQTWTSNCQVNYEIDNLPSVAESKLGKKEERTLEAREEKHIGEEDLCHLLQLRPH